jgi:hypothetical protein
MENDWLSVAIEEYKTLRTESIDAIKGQQTTFNIGTATIGVLTAAAFTVWDKPLLSDLIFMAFLPLTSYLILAVWIGEVSRMMRAGYFISLIENKINSHLKVEDALSWENWLRKKKRGGKTNQMKLNYLAIIALFLSLALVSIIIGNYRFFDKLSNTQLWIINIVEGIIFLVAFIYIYLTGKKYEKL